MMAGHCQNSLHEATDFLEGEELRASVRGHRDRNLSSPNSISSEGVLARAFVDPRSAALGRPSFVFLGFLMFEVSNPFTLALQGLLSVEARDDVFDKQALLKFLDVATESIDAHSRLQAGWNVDVG